MTGREYFNFPVFDSEAEFMRGLGWEVFSPADHDRELLGKPQKWMPSIEDSDGEWKYWNKSIENVPSLRKMLGDDLQWIASEADALVMLPGWENSRGARAEHALAVALDLKIMYR